jgi:CHAT domain-containing protein
VGNRAGEAVTLGNLRDYFVKSHADLAIVFGKQTINVLQSIRRDNQRLEQGLRHSYEKSIESHYRSLADLLIGRSRFGEAEEVLNLLKDKEAADFIRRDAVADQLKAATLLDSERQALERYEQILTQIVSEGEAKSALVAKSAKTALNGEESARSQQLDRDLSAANTILLRFFDEEEKTFAANSAAAKRVGELRESEGLQDALQALGPDVVAIYTLVLPDKYTALLVTSGSRKAYVTVISEVELNSKIFDFRQQLQNPASNPLPLAQELYKILFPAGLRQDLDSMGAKTIMWSIDSTIRYVPIAALHDGQQYLVARFRNSLITPASLTRLTQGSDTVWKGVGFGVSQANGNFTALPAVPAELRRIFRQEEAGDAPVAGPVKLDGDFTRETFEAAMRRPEKSVVHIATHFDSQPGVAANSHLLLGDGSEMSLAEIEATPRLFSGVDLLTLSACSTAFTNRTEDGREVDSFGTIAQRLGAKGVIASLWSVSDEATSRLMETMYRIRQAKPELGKSEALRQAQEQMAAGLLKPEAAGAEDRGVFVLGGRASAKDWTHPYYWAPFILIGNWK